MTISLTRHAQERMKKRTNYSPTRAEEIAEKAYYCGKTSDQFPKIVKKYLDNVLQRSKEEGRADELLVMGNDIYLFAHGTLITSFPIPDKVLRKAQNNKNKIRRQNEDEEVQDYN